MMNDEDTDRKVVLKCKVEVSRHHGHYLEQLHPDLTFTNELDKALRMPKKLARKFIASQGYQDVLEPGLIS